MTSNGRRPADVAEELGVPPSTLRRWSQQFADVLSPPRTVERGGQRRYLDSDVEVLAEVKRLLALGFTYREIHQQLMADRGIVDSSVQTLPASDDDDLGDTEAQQTFGAVIEPPSSLLPADDAQPSIGQLLATTLDSLSDSQQIILSNQQTARQLLGVLLQDNFNLKEENRRLREQMVETERRIYELKRELDAEQQQDQQRMRQLEANLFEMQRRLDGMAAEQTLRRPPATTKPAPVAPQPPPAAPQPISPATPSTVQTPPAQKKGFWDWLFGR